MENLGGINHEDPKLSSREKHLLVIPEAVELSLMVEQIGRAVSMMIEEVLRRHFQ